MPVESLPNLSHSAPAAVLDGAGGRLRAGIGALLELTKPRLAVFSVLSAIAGYAAAGGEFSTAARFMAAMAGISLAAGGALSLNQCLEWRLDGRMRRTRARPLPSGRITPVAAMGWSILLSFGGISLLTAMVDPVAGAWAAAIIFIYGLVYTPLKQRTRWATEIGAISGALPPVLGAAAAPQHATPEVWVFAAFVLFWQMPHFFAIGWIHRADYRAAGFRLRPALDHDGRDTANWSVGYAAALLLVSIIPGIIGWSGLLFTVVTGLASIALLAAAIAFRMATANRDRAARLLFGLTLLHLPLAMLALVAGQL